MLMITLLALLIVLLIGALPIGPLWWLAGGRWGYGPSSLLAVVVVIVVVLLLTGRL